MHILSVQPPRSANRRRTWTCCCRPGTGNDSCFRARPTCVQDNGGRPLGLIAATRSNEFPVVIGGGGGAGEGGARGRCGGCQNSPPPPSQIRLSQKVTSAPTKPNKMCADPPKWSAHPSKMCTDPPQPVGRLAEHAPTNPENARQPTEMCTEPPKNMSRPPTCADQPRKCAPIDRNQS